MASISGHATIVLRGDNGRREEYIIVGTPKPGTCVKRTPAERVMGMDTAVPGAAGFTGGSGGSGGGAYDVAIVVEQLIKGQTIDDAVTTGEPAPVHIPGKGDVCLVLALAGEDIDKEEGISFNSAGKAVAATTGLVAKSLDDTGGALAADTHIRAIFL